MLRFLNTNWRRKSCITWQLPGFLCVHAHLHTLICSVFLCAFLIPAGSKASFWNSSSLSVLFPPPNWHPDPVSALLGLIPPLYHIKSCLSSNSLVTVYSHFSHLPLIAGFPLSFSQVHPHSTFSVTSISLLQSSRHSLTFVLLYLTCDHIFLL